MVTSEQADISAHCYIQCSHSKQHLPFLSRSAFKDNQLNSINSVNPQFLQIEFQENQIIHIYSKILQVYNCKELINITNTTDTAEEVENKAAMIKAILTRQF